MLELKNISYTPNSGEFAAFENFSLSINYGEFVSLVSAQSKYRKTLLGIINGSLKANDGNVFLCGTDITKKSEKKRRVFIVNPETLTCENKTVLENMAITENHDKFFLFRAKAEKSRIGFYRELLESAGFGLENKLYSKVKTLSRVQKLALALTMSSIMPADLLLLNDLTDGLDESTAFKIMELCDRIISDKKLTALMITENIRDAVEYGDRLLTLHRGKIVSDVKGSDKSRLTVTEFSREFVKLS